MIYKVIKKSLTDVYVFDYGEQGYMTVIISSVLIILMRLNALGV